MSPRYFRALALLTLISLVGCTSLPFSLGSVTPPGNNPAEVIDIPTDTQMYPAPPTPGAADVTAGVTPAATSQFVRIWLPPEFDPDLNSVENQILQARLYQFEAMNPGVQLEVRVKALDGPGGMLDSLVATSAAAPGALPDLVLLPRPLLESAALKGLLYPFDGLTTIMDGGMWFEYALQMAHLKSSTYAIPFAGDIMVLAHSLPTSESTPLSLADTLSQGSTLLFPAADPQALFTLCLYLAEGGKLQDDQGRPELEKTPLLNILEYDQQASLTEVMPITLTQYTQDSQVWEALRSGQATLAITWTSTYLKNLGAEPSSLALATLPTPDGDPFTLAEGWSWALAGQDPARRSLGVRLAEFLVDKSFLAQWTQAADYVPPRVDALQEWPDSQPRQVIEQASYSAWLAPSPDLVSSIGPAVQNAVMSVLLGQSDAETAARLAIEQVSQP